MPRLFCVKIADLAPREANKFRPNALDAIRYFHMGMAVRACYSPRPKAIYAGNEEETRWMANIFCRGILGHNDLTAKLPALVRSEELSIDRREKYEVRTLAYIGRLVNFIFVHCHEEDNADVFFFTQLGWEIDQTMQIFCDHLARASTEITMADADDNVITAFDVAVVHARLGRAFKIERYMHPLTADPIVLYG